MLATRGRFECVLWSMLLMTAPYGAPLRSALLKPLKRKTRPAGEAVAN